MSSIELWYITRATGLAALVLLTVTVLLGILTAGRAPSTLPTFARAEIHRRISILTVIFLAIHVLTAVIDTYVNINWITIVIPFTSNYHEFWLALGTIGLDLILAIAISSALRRYISARAWRLLHWLAYVSWPVAMAHAWGMGTDAKLSWVLVLFILCSASVVGAAAWRVIAFTRANSVMPTTIITPRRSIRSSIGTPAEEKRVKT